MAVYTQRIGEDEQDFRPSLYLTQFGLETWGSVGAAAYRVYLEVADTLCGGNITGNGPANCAYNHPIYSTGMRYRGRSIGHTFDNDAEIWTLGGMLNDAGGHSWILTLGAGDLNRVGSPDSANTVAAVKTRYRSAQLTHRRQLRLGELQAGVGFESLHAETGGGRDDDWQLFLGWRHAWCNRRPRSWRSPPIQHGSVSWLTACWTGPNRRGSLRSGGRDSSSRCDFPFISGVRPRWKLAACPLAGVAAALLVAVHLLPGRLLGQPRIWQTDSGTEDGPALISRDEAVALVRRQSDGRVLRAERHVVNGRVYYKVRMLSADGRVRDFEVDAVTGRVR